MSLSLMSLSIFKKAHVALSNLGVKGHVSVTVIGAIGGGEGSPCRMSNSGNVNVPCHLNVHVPCRL